VIYRFNAFQIEIDGSGNAFNLSLVSHQYRVHDLQSYGFFQRSQHLFVCGRRHCYPAHGFVTGYFYQFRQLANHTVMLFEVIY